MFKCVPYYDTNKPATKLKGGWPPELKTEPESYRGILYIRHTLRLKPDADADGEWSAEFIADSIIPPQRLKEESGGRTEYATGWIDQLLLHAVSIDWPPDRTMDEYREETTPLLTAPAKQYWDEFLEILSDACGREPDQLTPETTLRDLGFDSLDTVELAMSIEDTFEVAISDSDVEAILQMDHNVVTLHRCVVDQIEKSRKKQSHGSTNVGQ